MIGAGRRKHISVCFEASLKTCVVIDMWKDSERGCRACRDSYVKQDPRAKPDCIYGKERSVGLLPGACVLL